MTGDFTLIFSPSRMQAAGNGPLYVKLRRTLEEAVKAGALKQGDALPPERDIAEYAAVSRVTVRKAIDELVADGLLMRRHGSGTFVSKPVSKVEQKLSQLTSFTEDMARRGMKASSEWLHKGIHTPSPDEMMILGLAAGTKVSRLRRLRVADDQPLAIEHASVSGEFLPDPSIVTTSLYAELEKRQVRPVRAVQRISATNMKEADAELLGVSAGAAGLSIERISYLASGRAVEFTRSLYRGDAYDFVAELTIGESSADRRSAYQKKASFDIIPPGGTMDNIELTDEDERFIRKQLETGDYDSAADVVRAGLRMLEEHDALQETWLRSEVANRYDELESGSATAIPADDVFARLEQRHKARSARNG